MPLMRKQWILKIKDELYVNNCKLMHRLEYGNMPVPIKHLYPTASHGYTTRNIVVKIVTHCSDIVNRSFLCKPVIEWQQADTQLKCLENVKRFAKKLKQSILSKY